MRKLTEKQQKFAEGKAAGLSNHDAGIAAGYAPLSVHVQASNLMGRADIKAAIKAAKKDQGGSKKEQEVVAGEVEDDKGVPAKFGSSLELMQHAYNNPRLPWGVRFEAAKQALPYEHAKVGEKGKKGSAKDVADAITQGHGRGRSPIAPPGSNVTPLRRGG